MHKKLFEIEKKLEERDSSSSVILLPVEMRDGEIAENLKEIYKGVLREASNDNKLIPFLSGFTSLPVEEDLNKIEILLRKYEPIKGDFFENKLEDKEEVKEESTGFKKATLKKNISKKESSNKEIDENANVENYILDRIRNEILESTNNISWEDIVGLEKVKKTINEIVLWPMLRPDLFTGLRGPPKVSFYLDPQAQERP
ncbi:Fidgetin-like protein 1 [Nosema granulosis]|uniref:Fidgetin-like protein 1 n=1 Tax=Nosema granulosis TaxID=83296 RepID=A0A9P6GUU2_9MICR|nr:Fidgetin-like protein 1 [Nosema granulosis]